MKRYIIVEDYIPSSSKEKGMGWGAFFSGMFLLLRTIGLIFAGYVIGQIIRGLALGIWDVLQYYVF